MNEQQLRAFVLDGLDWLSQGATITGTTIDDKAIAVVRAAVSSDLAWSWIFGLIARFLDGDDDPSPLVMSPDVDESIKAAAINPLLIFAVIKAIVKLWKSLKE